MSTSILHSIATPAPEREDRAHKQLIAMCVVTSLAGVAMLLYYGLDYYLTPPLDRPYHPRNAMLRPGGPVGLSLGVFGFFLFLLIFLYPLRKRWAWLARMGNSRHWFNFHVLMGLIAPVVVAFHASFKFRGLAGMAYWIMFAVAVSGLVGRYVYAQIPRSRNSAELSLQELKALQERLTADLGSQNVVRPADLALLFRLPSPTYVQRGSMFRALLVLLWIDLCRPWRVARLRRQVLGFGEIVSTFGGLHASRNRKLERIITVAREQAGLSKKLLFLSKSQQVFHLWHVVHRPFSYSFAVLALIHVGVALMFRFR